MKFQQIAGTPRILSPSFGISQKLQTDYLFSVELDISVSLDDTVYRDGETTCLSERYSEASTNMSPVRAR